MKLHRLALLTLNEEFEAPSQLEVTLGLVSLTVQPVTFEGNPDPRRLLIATVDVPDGVPFDDRDHVVVPAKSRLAAEDAIETVADFLAVFHRTGRKIGSPRPCIALSDLTSDERQRLNGSAGFEGGQMTMAAVAALDLDERDLVHSLSDRLTGVALLAECLSTDHPVARYKAFVRYFENGFARSLPHLEKKLSQFLAPVGLGYSRAEVQGWVAARHRAVHGDRPDLVMEQDVRPLLPRIQQAAYDLLFNKKVWHDPSKTRRDVLKHRAGTTSPDMLRVSVTQGSEGAIQAQLLDAFGAYPLDLGGVMTEPPSDWWWRPRTNQEQERAE